MREHVHRYAKLKASLVQIRQQALFNTTTQKTTRRHPELFEIYAALPNCVHQAARHWQDKHLHIHTYIHKYGKYCNKKPLVFTPQACRQCLCLVIESRMAECHCLSLHGKPAEHSAKQTSHFHSIAILLPLLLHLFLLFRLLLFLLCTWPVF